MRSLIPAFCNTIGPDYQKMVGLNLLKGFRQELKQAVRHRWLYPSDRTCADPADRSGPGVCRGGVCTREGDDADEDGHKPFQLDRCHALRTDGAAVATVLSTLGQKYQQNPNPVSFLILFTT